MREESNIVRPKAYHLLKMNKYEYYFTSVQLSFRLSWSVSRPCLGIALQVAYADCPTWLASIKLIHNGVH